MTLVLGVPPSILDLNQKGLLERAFHEGLYPNLNYRSEAIWEEWPANTGTEVVMTRAGLLTPIVKALVPGSDPIPASAPFEQWVATLGQYAGTDDAHMPTVATSNANLFLQKIKTLGLQAGQSINRVARNEMFKAYLSGQTVLILATAAADTQIRVAALNGFTDVVNPASNTRPLPISSANPLPIRIMTATPISRNAVGFLPDDPNDPFGPGTLMLDAAVGAIVPVRTAVLSRYAPRIVRTAAGNSVDAISASDTLVMQSFINAVAFLRRANVQPFDDGFFHAHISPLGNAQVFSDPVMQRLNQSLPEHMVYKEGFIGTLQGIAFFMNTESPDQLNTGTRVQTSASATPAFYSPEVGAETTNNTGVNIGRLLITGKGILRERGLDEANYVTEAGVNGKVGEFDVVNQGIQISTDRIRLILRAPQDRLQHKVAMTWSISTSFPVPSDVSAPSGPERFKRGIVVEYAES